MNRLVVISRCDECPYFDNVYWGYNERCRKLDRKIDSLEGQFDVHEIPEDCPLPKVSP